MSTTTPDTTATVQEIAAAREEMGQTLYLIADKVAPKKVIARLKETARTKAHDKVAELKARANPARLMSRKGRDRKVILAPSRPALPR